MKTLLVAAIKTSTVWKNQSPPDMHCIFQNCQHGNTTISLGNIPCDSQTLLQSVLKALIHLQTREYTHYAAPPLQGPQRDGMNLRLADGDKALNMEGGWGVDSTSWRQPTHRQTSYLAVQ